MLTKALGTGVIGQAIKKGLASEPTIAAAIASMTTLNQGAARVGHAHGVTSATDVTGFGLLGHLRNIVRGSRVGARHRARSRCRCSPRPPRSCAPRSARPAARRTARTSRRSCGGRMGRRSRRHPATTATASCSPRSRATRRPAAACCCACPSRRAAACVDELRALGLPAAQIGELVDGDGIELR